MQGKHSGCMMWPGTDFKYQNVSCSYTHNFNVTESWYSRIDLALSWFQQKINSANLVMVYIEEPDRHGHAFSPDSDVVSVSQFFLDSLHCYYSSFFFQS